MNRLLSLLCLGAVACSAATLSNPDPQSASDSLGAIDTTVVNGPLKLALHDFLARPGVFWALPSAATSPGTITVESTRYGSLCALAVTGAASVTPGHVTLDISFEPRTTVCTAEIRALRYTATVAAPRGAYDLLVVHHESSRADTVVHRAITVP